jgi:hypothetical protein
MPKRKHNQLERFGAPRGTRHGNPQRKAGLNYLNNLRNDGGLGHQEWASVVLSIPELDFIVLCKRFPELQSPDAEINRRAWERFLVSSDSAPYRVRTTDGKGKARQSSIIKPERLR